MKKPYFLISLLLIVLQANAQSPTLLKRKLVQSYTLNRQLKEENKNLHDYQKKLITIVSNVRDSLNTEMEANKKMALFVQRVTTDNKKIQEENNINYDKIQKLSDDLSASEKRVVEANYEKEILSNPEIVCIYNAPMDDVKLKYIGKLGEDKLGFKYDEKDDNIYKITKAFGSDTEAWWVFDKTIDILLEITVKFQPHKFDKNRTLAYVSTNLLEKVRFSNKQFTPQDDPDKIALYQKKAIRVLEEDLKSSK